MIMNGINIPEPEEGWIYLDAVVLIKCMDADGEIRYRETKSPGITHVEALGMVETYQDTLRSKLMRRATRED